jgi:catalase
MGVTESSQKPATIIWTMLLPRATAPTTCSTNLPNELLKGPVRFRILVQLANDGDIVDDATVHWPEDRTLLELGTLVLTEPVANGDHEQRHIIFDPIPRVDGIDPSDDPLLELRAAIYLLSGRRRRTAIEK